MKQIIIYSIKYKNNVLENKWVELCYQPFLYRYFDKLNSSMVSKTYDIY